MYEIKTQEIMTKYIFTILRVYNEVDFMCHYATKKEYEKWQGTGQNSKEYDKIIEKTLKRVILKNIEELERFYEEMIFYD